eukprot:CAMPEP_0204597648 /NCGR_PEP_ID=MMETSP0661-20131031/53913_1 /ASSEMBLY_ACC=CAM_ASM_000606 /TAXON_ID=109239 /ORGANISM="Alexandrium margalefi, Strain AMGDE01CS-322" /LENGTH=526 /DNA_ID=CAMNT_0051608345 /DNA_START=91 /DNA_END=1671 /DNA_ORIENTATION=+
MRRCLGLYSTDPVIELLSPEFRQGLKLMVVLVIPFAALQVIACFALCMWLAAARHTMPRTQVLETPPNNTNKLLAESPAGEQTFNKPPAGPQKEQTQDLEVPRLVMWFLYTGNLMLNVNFTLVLPASERVMLDAGGSTLLSGVCIGSYAIGALVSLPFIIRLSRRSYRDTVLLMAVVAVIGNLAYAAMGLFHGSVAIAGLIFARAMCGIAGGVVIMFMSAVVQLSSGAATATGVARVVLAGSLGLVLGPAAASASQTCLPRFPPEVPPAVTMVLAAAAYGLAAWKLFPGQAECFVMAGLQDPQALQDSNSGGMEKGEPSYSEVQRRKAWLFLGLTCVQCICRAFQRVFWEAGILLLLVEEYGFSERTAGFIVTLPVLASLPIILSAAAIYRLGLHPSLRVLELLEILGVLLMLRVEGQSHSRSLALLMIGSSVFYAANWMTAGPFTATRASFSVDGHWALGVEALTGISWGAAFIGYFYGPVVSRAILGTVMSQNLLAVSLIVVWLGCLLTMEVGLHTLLAEETSA